MITLTPSQQLHSAMATFVTSLYKEWKDKLLRQIR